MTIVSVDISFLFSNACILTTIFCNSLTLVTVGPVVIPLACAFTFVASRSRSRSRMLDAAECILKKMYLSVVLSILFFLHYSVSFAIFLTFAYDSLDDVKAYLHADYSITCYTETYTACIKYASLMACFNPVKIPAFLMWCLLRNRGEFKKPERQSMSDLHSSRFQWAAYRPALYYYEVVEGSCRIVLTRAFFLLVLADTAKQVAIVLL